jgi:P-type Ca2+ transporter type 2C
VFDRAYQFQERDRLVAAFAAGLSFASATSPRASPSSCVLLINGAIGFFTELRAARSMEALMRIAGPHPRAPRTAATR